MRIRILLIMTCLAILSPCLATANEVVIIANADVPENTLSDQELRNIFNGTQRTWSDRSRVEIATLSDSPCHEVFTQTYLNRTSRQFENHWRRLVFSGRARTIPNSFSTEQEMIRFVGSTPGAIGYLPAGTPIDDSVKIIHIK